MLTCLSVLLLLLCSLQNGSVIFAEIGIQMLCHHSPLLGYDTKDSLNFYGYDNMKFLNQRGRKSLKTWQ